MKEIDIIGYSIFVFAIVVPAFVVWGISRKNQNLLKLSDEELRRKHSFLQLNPAWPVIRFVDYSTLTYLAELISNGTKIGTFKFKPGPPVAFTFEDHRFDAKDVPRSFWTWTDFDYIIHESTGAELKIETISYPQDRALSERAMLARNKATNYEGHKYEFRVVEIKRRSLISAGGEVFELTEDGQSKGLACAISGRLPPLLATVDNSLPAVIKVAFLFYALCGGRSWWERT